VFAEDLPSRPELQQLVFALGASVVESTKPKPFAGKRYFVTRPSSSAPNDVPVRRKAPIPNATALDVVEFLNLISGLREAERQVERNEAKLSARTLRDRFNSAL